jgi:hypothetical protein
MELLLHSALSVLAVAVAHLDLLVVFQVLELLATPEIPALRLRIFYRVGERLPQGVVAVALVVHLSHIRLIMPAV